MDIKITDLKTITGPQMKATGSLFFFQVLVLITSITFFSSCQKEVDYYNLNNNNNNNNNDSNNYNNIKPTGPNPFWAPNITPQMLAVIEVLDTIAPLPVSELTPAQARQQPSPADAVKRLMRNFNISSPPVKVDTTGRDIPVANGSIHLRIYTPQTGKSSYPVIVYYHGGGWVIGTIDTYDASAQALAEKTDAVVVSVEYRKGPEFKFPTAHNDAYEAYLWVLNNASLIKGDSSKIAVAGEGAGGNMAVTVSIMARDNNIRKPLHQLSVYPVASNDPNTPSKLQHVNAKPLGTPALSWFLSHYLNTPAESANPLISLVNADLSDLPNTTIIAAEIDPLLSEGFTLRDRIEAANVSTTYKVYAGVTHEFFGMATVLPEAKEAQDLAAKELKKAFQ